jgi:hypothetical protein
MVGKWIRTGFMTIILILAVAPLLNGEAMILVG